MYFVFLFTCDWTLIDRVLFVHEVLLKVHRQLTRYVTSTALQSRTRDPLNISIFGYSCWTLELHILHVSPMVTDVKESLLGAWQTIHQCIYNIPQTYFFIHFMKHRHFFWVTCGCFRPWIGSGKCMIELLKLHFLFLAMIWFVQVNKCNNGQKYKVMF